MNCCQLCGQPTRSAIGFCQRTPRCKTAYVHALRHPELRSEPRPELHCLSCGAVLRRSDPVVYCCDRCHVFGQRIRRILARLERLSHA